MYVYGGDKQVGTGERKRTCAMYVFIRLAWTAANITAVLSVYDIASAAL